MSRLLLDTHALLWWLSDDPRLGAQARRQIVDGGAEVMISIVSLWEIAIKQRIGKLDADLAEIESALSRDGFTLLPIERGHLLRLVDLTQHHRDPFDHLLIAQAIVEGATFLTDDDRAMHYPVKVQSCG